jgi:L-Ala-D/L-Glu epimerase
VPRVKEVILHRRTISLKRPFVTAIRTAESIEILLVEVRDSDGRSGWGEAPTSWRVTGESVEGVTAAINGALSGAVIGASSSEPDAASDLVGRAAIRNSSARMAIECAIYDLSAQHAGVPLFRYLGGDTSQVRTDMTLSAVVRDDEIEALCRTSLEFVTAGMNTLKLKVGGGGDDVKAAAAVRRAVGSDVGLRLDANQGWSPDQAVAIISALEDAGVGLEFVEQPVHADNIEGLAHVTARVHTPVMADESVWTSRQLREVLRIRATDMVNVKIAKAGGLREARDLVNLAHENDMEVIIGCMAESHVGISAAAALASYCESRTSLGAGTHDLDGGLLLSQSPVTGGVIYDRDHVRLPLVPGTGITGMTLE